MGAGGTRVGARDRRVGAAGLRAPRPLTGDVPSVTGGFLKTQLVLRIPGLAFCSQDPVTVCLGLSVGVYARTFQDTLSRGARGTSEDSEAGGTGPANQLLTQCCQSGTKLAGNLI